MLLFVCIAIVASLLLMGGGAFLMAVALVLAAIFSAVGMFSTSVLVGVLSQKVSLGVRALHYQICTVLTVVSAFGAVWAAGTLLGLALRGWQVALLGMFIGVPVGLMFAFALDVLAVYAHKRLTAYQASLGARPMPPVPPMAPRATAASAA